MAPNSKPIVDTVEMTLPLSSSGKIEMSIVTDTEQLNSKVAETIIAGLVKKKASDIHQNENKITFYGGGGGDNLNPSLLITSGEINIFTEGKRIIIRYCIRFTHSFIFTLLLVLVGGFVDGFLRNNFVGGLALMAALWLVLFGLNVLLALIRFPLLLHRSIAKALHLSPST